MPDLDGSTKPTRPGIRPRLFVPTWGQLKEMAEEIKVLCPDIGVRASYETFYALNYLQSIVSDPATDGSPIHD